MKGRNYTNFDSNLAMMVMYLPVKFEFDWTKHFRVRVRKLKFLMDRQMDKTETNEHTELTPILKGT